MKKIYTLLFTIIFTSSWLLAQPNLNLGSKVNVPIPNYEQASQKTVSCIDTIRYPQTKLTAIEYDTMTTWLREGAAQFYQYNGSGTIYGMTAYMLLDFDGIPGNTDSVQLMARVMKVNSFYEPITHIDSSLVTIHDVGYNEQVLMFDSPISITDSFAIALEITSGFNDTLFYITNSSVNFDGGGEGLASIAFQGVWYNYYMRGWGWDIDMIMSPIFEQDITASYSIDTNTVCLGNPVTFTNTSGSSVDSMFFTAPYTYNLDLDDLSNTSLDTNYMHTYASSGVFNSSLQVTHYGYSTNCVDSMSIPITVLDTAIANYNFSPMGGGTYQFTDASTIANTYYWDFGDGDTSTTQSPMHTFSIPNTYNVCLTVTDTNECNVNTFCQNVSFVTGIEQLSNVNEVNIFPVPANKYFNIQVPAKLNDGTILLTDIVGKTIKRINVENQEQIKILTNNINSGVYFVSIENNGQKVYTKRIIIDKN